jgi:hypothetical protein
MLNKQITRKQFLLSTLSVVGLVALSKVPAFLKTTPKESSQDTASSATNGYGNSAYGGSSK